MPAKDDLKDIAAKLKRAKRIGRLGEDLLREIGKVVGPLLHNPNDELEQELGYVWKLLDACREHPRGRPENVIYSPEPGHYLRIRRRIWWLQTLLMVAQGYPTRRQLLHPNGLVPRLNTCDEALLAAQGAMQCWSLERGDLSVIKHIEESLEYLKGTLPSMCMIDGCYLVWQGGRIDCKLSKKQRTFLELLIKAEGRPVTEQKFEAQGIRDAKKLKSCLALRPGFKFLKTRIRGGPKSGGYLLVHG